MPLTTKWWIACRRAFTLTIKTASSTIKLAKLTIARTMNASHGNMLAILNGTANFKAVFIFSLFWLHEWVLLKTYFIRQINDYSYLFNSLWIEFSVKYFKFPERTFVFFIEAQLLDVYVFDNKLTIDRWSECTYQLRLVDTLWFIFSHADSFCRCDSFVCYI